MKAVRFGRCVSPLNAERWSDVYVRSYAWVQAIIDWCFFWQNYDARRVLAAFTERASNSTDLDTLTVDLVGVVQDTLEPEQAALWLVRRP